MTRFAAALAPILLLATSLPAQIPGSGSEWWREAVCYEVFVRSFYDSDGDGVGDLPGLIRKLDYINDGDPATLEDLGATCIWLMPIAQSPSYHGYDVTNHYHVNGDYGTNDDFRRLMEEAHRRGIHVIVDLVLNHLSAEHPYFKSALLDPASPYRDWFLWSDTARVVRGWEATVWHRSPVRDEYYYGLFWGGMPDVNLANPEARAEAERVATYWLEEMGADGFRLDAVAHLFESGDTVKHASANHPWLRGYGSFIRAVDPASFTIGEVWDSTGALIPYYPDQLDAYFAFEIADGILDAVRTGSADGLFAALARAERDLPRGRWAPFLRNHDQPRTMTELGGDTARARLASTILLTLPGIPFVYYGEEIGMTGAKPDPRIRTPMHWKRAPAAGFTTGVPWEPLQPDSFTANVEVQAGDPGSLLNVHRRLIHLRSASPALARGRIVPLRSSEAGAMGYLRQEGEEAVLIVANLTGERIEGAALSSAAGVLPPGAREVRSLHGGRDPAPLRIAGDGSMVRWVPLPALEPFEAHVIRIGAAPPR